MAIAQTVNRIMNGIECIYIYVYRFEMPFNKPHKRTNDIKHQIYMHIHTNKMNPLRSDKRNKCTHEQKIGALTITENNIPSHRSK